MSSSRPLDWILEPLGLPFGSFLAPKMAETCLGIPLGAAKSRSRLLFSAPRAPQEASKSLPLANGSLHLADQACLRASRDLQHASKRPPEPIWQPYWYHLGSILKQFRCDVAPMLVRYSRRRLLRQGPSIQGPRPSGMRVSDPPPTSGGAGRASRMLLLRRPEYAPNGA